MFVELMPVIQDRSVTITVSSAGKGQIRVNIIPAKVEGDKKLTGQDDHKISSDVPKEIIKALTAAVSLVGTPEEIDAELSNLLTTYADGNRDVKETLKDLTETLSAAKKAAEEAKKKATAKPAAKPAEKKDEKGKVNPHPTKKAGAEPTAKAPETFNLFDAASSVVTDEEKAAIAEDESAAGPPADDEDEPIEVPEEEAA
jgi:PRTRC genetic system protein E